MTTSRSARFTASAFACVLGLIVGATAGASQPCARPNLASDDARHCIAAATETSYTQARGDDSPFAACVSALPNAIPCPVAAKASADDLPQALMYLGAAFEILHSQNERLFEPYRRVGLLLGLRVLTNAEASRDADSHDDALSSLRFLMTRMQGDA